MHISIRDAKARFSEAIAAAIRGERVIITRYGLPVAELSAPTSGQALDFAAADKYLAEIGWDADAMALPDNFDDPSFSRSVLGLDDCSCCLIPILRIGSRLSGKRSPGTNWQPSHPSTTSWWYRQLRSGSYA